MKKFGNPGTVMPRYARLARPVFLERPAVTTNDAEAGEVVRRLEAGGHDDDVDARSDPSASTMPSRHRRDGARDQLHVLLLERGIERAREDRPLAGVRVLRRDGLAQVGAVGELAVDVVEAELPARLVGLGAGPVEMPAPQAPLQQVPLPPAVRRRRHGLAKAARSSSVKSRSPLGMTHPGSRWNT